MPVATLVRPGARGALPPAALAALVRRTARRVRVALRALGRARVHVTLVLTGDEELRELNRRFRGIDRATDVLSFHLLELDGEGDARADGDQLGDIVISLRTAARRAPGRRLPRELEILAIHGLCHLFGHDHKRPTQARRMFALQRRLLRLPLPPERPARGAATASGRSGPGRRRPAQLVEVVAAPMQGHREHGAAGEGSAKARALGVVERAGARESGHRLG